MRQGKVSIASCPAQVKTQIDPTGEDKHEATKDEPTDGNKDEPTGRAIGTSHGFRLPAATALCIQGGIPHCNDGVGDLRRGGQWGCLRLPMLFCFTGSQDPLPNSLAFAINSVFPSHWGVSLGTVCQLSSSRLLPNVAIPCHPFSHPIHPRHVPLTPPFHPQRNCPTLSRARAPALGTWATLPEKEPARRARAAAVGASLPGWVCCIFFCLALVAFMDSPLLLCPPRLGAPATTGSSSSINCTESRLTALPNNLQPATKPPGNGRPSKKPSTCGIRYVCKSRVMLGWKGRSFMISLSRTTSAACGWNCSWAATGSEASSTFLGGSRDRKKVPLPAVVPE
ncbi:MAG: hypothetical protein FRX49_02592 [Trebouxia sp. A1-2]|nr:MAG: hypothetical protein FRX49_02592 [Trebouxia sp. A1-2]